MLIILSKRRSTLGDHAFPVLALAGWLAARAWNALPSSATAKTITYLLV